MILNPVKIAAIADVHSPRFLNEFKTALSRCQKPDLFLFAGDMINRGKAPEYINILDTLDSQFGSDFPIVACFGNEDPLDIRDEVLSLTEGRLTFLDDNSLSLRFAGHRISIVGMSTVGLNPTDTQTMGTIFEKRAKDLSRLLQNATSSSDYVILLMHYSPLLETNPNQFSWWVSKVVQNATPNLIVHGHVHNSPASTVTIGTTTVRNVALPVLGSITALSIEETKED
jgi:Icc-related predicted phosphoesterase